MWLKFPFSGNSLAVQWLKLHTSTAEGTGSILGQGTKILNAKWHKKKKISIFLQKENQSSAVHLPELVWSPAMISDGSLPSPFNSQVCKVPAVSRVKHSVHYKINYLIPSIEQEHPGSCLSIVPRKK